MSNKKSFINYIGSKSLYINEIGLNMPLVKKGLDLFGGSAVVAINFNLDYNDIDDYVATCYRDLKQIEVDRLIALYRLSEDLTPYTAGDYRVNKEHYNKLVEDYRLDSSNIHLKFLVKFFAHSMDGNINPLVSKIRAGKFRYPKLKNQELFLNRKITHLNFRDVDFSEYDFLFVDPPYINSDFRFQYGGWSVDDEMDLINKLAAYQGKFLMTNYLNTHLAAAAEKNRWYTKKIATKMNSANFIKHSKEEYFIYNYQNGLF